jgi:hypothetical protein
LEIPAYLARDDQAPCLPERREREREMVVSKGGGGLERWTIAGGKRDLPVLDLYLGSMAGQD